MGGFFQKVGAPFGKHFLERAPIKRDGAFRGGESFLERSALWPEISL